MEPLIVAIAIFAAVLGITSQTDPHPQLTPEVTEIIKSPAAWRLEGVFTAIGCHEGFAVLGNANGDSLAGIALAGMREINHGQFGPAEDTCAAAVFSRKAGRQKSYAVAVVNSKFKDRLHKGASYIITSKDDDIVIAEK